MNKSSDWDSMGPLNWVTDESMEESRLSIEVWFRGAVITVRQMEDTLIDEKLDEMFPLKDVNCEDDKVYNLKMWSKRIMHSLDSAWCNKYLRSLNPDKYYKDKRVD